MLYDVFYEKNWKENDFAQIQGIIGVFQIPFLLT